MFLNCILIHVGVSISSSKCSIDVIVFALVLWMIAILLYFICMPAVYLMCKINEINVGFRCDYQCYTRKLVWLSVTDMDGLLLVWVYRVAYYMAC